ncbi:universal stress protein [Pontibacter qinzhouensis]|uniref:Universal stress protein n=1 Tax=Pontibacter qinzhouensis TaxID=2603253 RepID=A0A5C8KE77_9BACT|nr:universal stress protein [Pontibacter qinzhouensis]TXK51883.1 universal stress protein [Pontibacter qinzhouensis]
MKKIVIPTNLTIQSLNLIKYGLQVLKGEVCQIYLLHLIPLPDSIPELLMLPREEERLEKINTPFNKTLDRIRKSYAVEISSLHVIHLYGDSPIKVQNFIDNNNIDLILSPVSSTTISEKDSYHSFSSLVKDVSCPVLYIPDNAETTDFRKIAYVLDTDDKYTLLLDDLLLNLTSTKNYYVTFLVIFKPGTNMEKLEYVLNKVYMNEKLKGINCSVHLLQENNFTGGVYTFVEEFKVDLLVTGRKKNLFDTIFTRKRISSDVAKHTRVPFLTIS